MDIGIRGPAIYCEPLVDPFAKVEPEEEDVDAAPDIQPITAKTA